MASSVSNRFSFLVAIIKFRAHRSTANYTLILLKHLCACCLEKQQLYTCTYRFQRLLVWQVLLPKVLLAGTLFDYISHVSPYNSNSKSVVIFKTILLLSHNFGVFSESGIPYLRLARLSQSFSGINPSISPLQIKLGSEIPYHFSKHFSVSLILAAWLNSRLSSHIVVYTGDCIFSFSAVGTIMLPWTL